MTTSYTGQDLNDEPKKPETEGGPPPVEQPHLPGKPHHLEARLAGLEPELRELFEKTLADKYNSERNFKTADERVRQTETKLNALMQEKQAAETKRMEEQGQYKELAAKAEARAAELENRMAQQTIQASLDRELMASGAVETELLSAALNAKYGDVLRENPAKASELVARLKEEKPLLFKAAAPELPPAGSPTQPQTRSTGQPGTQPQPGVAPSPFNALDKKISIQEVEDQYAAVMKNANFFGTGQ